LLIDDAVPDGAPINGSSCCIDTAIPIPIAQSPLPKSDTSTTDGSPVRNFFTSAAATPPARFVPEIVSP